MVKTKIILVMVLGAVWMVGGKMEVMAATGVKISPTVTIASPSATIVPTEAVATKENITETTNKEAVYRLESVLDRQKIGGWNGFNTARIIVRRAVDRGVAANTIVLLLLLPLIATGVSVLHYIFGFSGYGIFMPSMIAVAFLATGIVGGLGLFAMILGISLVCNELLKRFKLHFWPGRSINLMFIALGTFGLMLLSSYFKMIDITKISIFPVLFMIMLAEEFVRTQLAKSGKEAKKLMTGTLILSIFGAGVMSIRQVQEWVILYPEIVVIVVLTINLIVGNYRGIRLLEIRRFEKAIRDKEGVKKKKKEE